MVGACELQRARLSVLCLLYGWYHPFSSGHGIPRSEAMGRKWNKSRLASSERDNEPLHTERQTSTDQSQPKPFDVEKWNALLKYDQDIANEAEKLRPLGDKWVDEFARAYLVLNDKQYLPGIVRKIISDAKIEDDERQRWQQQEYQKQEEQKREKQERDQRTSTSGFSVRDA